MCVYILHEIEGGSILGGWSDLEDARAFLNWGEADGTLIKDRYKISEVKIK